MPRGLWKKTKQYVLDTFREEDPEEYFKYKTKSAHGLSQDELEFMQAIKSHSIQKVRTLLNRGVDPNFFKKPGNRQTPLHLAVEGAACDKIVGVLLFFGANPNAQDNVGCSPLHTACLHGNATAVELLVQAGADVNLTDNYLETPLMTACKVAHNSTCDIVDLLLEAGAIVSCTNERKQSVLHILTCANPLATRTEVWMMEDRFVLEEKVLNRGFRHVLVEKILRHGLSANIEDSQGLSPLCYELLMLLKAPSLEPELEAKRLLTAKALICGGAVFEIREQYNSSLTRRLGVHTYAPNFNNLIQLFRDVCPVIPRPCLERWHQHIRHIGMTENTAALQKELEAFNSRVPSLLQISKLCLRQCLGGHVWCYTKCLPLPDKMKDYICSV